MAKPASVAHRIGFLLVALLSSGLLLAQTQNAAQPATSVIVDSNPALFTVLCALNAVGYDAGVSTTSTDPAAVLRVKIRQQLAAKSELPVVQELKAYYLSHHRDDPAQDLQQYTSLALFLGNPPGLSLTVPSAGLPPEAAAVSDIVPLLARFYADAGIEKVWDDAQPAFELALAQDSALARATLGTVDAFFRIPRGYATRQLFIFPDPMLSPTQSDALSYSGNYYIAVNLDLKSQLHQVRHTYLHFVLDPILAQYPAIFTQVGEEILPQVARAPALEVQYKRDPQLFATECLVRAIEIQLDQKTLADRQQAATSAAAHGLVLTPYWVDQLTAFRADPANFIEFYPVAAFAARLDEIGSQSKKINFAPAPPLTTVTSTVAEAAHVKGLVELGQERLDAHDLPGAAALANAALQKPGSDRGEAYFLLGKIATEQNQPNTAITQFQSALAVANASPHVKTWSNIFLARLFDAENNRAEAIVRYKAAMLTADTPISKNLATAGIKAPYRPPAAH
ncbi:MAG TPA: tetratricopeptide repeat protein [Terriglobales bacterium]